MGGSDRAVFLGSRFILTVCQPALQLFNDFFSISWCGFAVRACPPRWLQWNCGRLIAAAFASVPLADIALQIDTNVCQAVFDNLDERSTDKVEREAGALACESDTSQGSLERSRG